MSTPKQATYMNPELGPLPFCPGCGHEGLLKALDAALVKLQPDPKKVVIVTDIGCIGLSDRYFATSAFHGLHGRSITYACGLKLARPELTVITLKGDGGCGIGGTHLLNVARRNIGITLIVANNFNYGMTGGQHSVTTPTGGLTATTPAGNLEGPMDLCATAGAAGAAWVHRTHTFDKKLPDVLASAIEQPGFAMVDVWELCTAYYMPRNDLKKKQLLSLADDLGFQFGQQADRPRPEYTARYKEVYEATQGTVSLKPAISAQFKHNLDKQTGVLIAGSAGQKIKSMATTFAEGAMFSGLMATQKDDYPITVQTGHSVSEIVLSPDRIDYTGLDTPEVVIVLSADGLKRVRAKIQHLPETSTVYAEESLELPATDARVLRFAFSKIGREVGKLSVVTAALGAMLQERAMFPLGAFEAAIARAQNPKVAETNAKALGVGAALIGR